MSTHTAQLLNKPRLLGAVALLSMGLSLPLLADETQPPALIAIIIDDLGNQLRAGRRAIAIEAPVACSVMPYTAYSTKLASEAHAAGKEVMLHLPMQPMQMNRIAGPGEISLDNGNGQLRRILNTDLASVPYAVGINNHMGSLMTRHPGHMRWLMQALADHGDLFFIDSRTTPASVAYDMALEQGIPTARRHVFLDDDPAPGEIARQFERLKKQAAERGYAIGIGHPYPTTLTFLEQTLPTLQGDVQYRMIAVGRLVDLLETGELVREQHDTLISLASRQAGAH